MALTGKKISELDSATVGALATKMGITPSDVYLYEFGNQTFTISLSLTLTGMTSEIIDNSILLCTYNPSNESASCIMPIPGTISTGTYILRSTWWNNGGTYTFLIKANNWNLSAHNTSKTLRNLKVYIIKLTPIT